MYDWIRWPRYDFSKGYQMSNVYFCTSHGNYQPDSRGSCPKCAEPKPAQPAAPREWWLLENPLGGLPVVNTDAHPGKYAHQHIHVIEHSAYTALLAETEALAGALEMIRAEIRHELNVSLVADLDKALERWAAWRGK